MLVYDRCLVWDRRLRGSWSGSCDGGTESMVGCLFFLLAAFPAGDGDAGVGVEEGGRLICVGVGIGVESGVGKGVAVGGDKLAN